MSAQKIHCPHCQQKIEIPNELLGQTINCPACNNPFQIPKPPEPPRLAISGSRPAQPDSNVPPPLAQTATGQAKPQYPDLAPLGPRIGAKAVDIFLLTAAMIALAYGSHYLVHVLYQNGVSRETQAQIGTVILFVTIVLPFLYHFFLLGSGGATLGKQVFGLKVIRQNRQPLGFVGALLRTAVEFVCVGACFGLAMMIFIGLTRNQIYAPGFHRYNLLGMLFHFFIFLLALAPYVPAFFTRNHQAVQDMIVQSVVVKA